MRGVSALLLAGCVFVAARAWSEAAEERVIDIGSRLEPIVDRFLIDTLDGAALRLQTPLPGEKVLALDRPWEGRFCGYTTVIEDSGHYRMYYRGLPRAGKDGSDLETTCYAESRDGVHWTRPSLGIHEVCGTLENNVILAGQAPFSHNFAPFLDARPDVPEDARFKAVAGTQGTGLMGFASADGIHWRRLQAEPIITGGAFDSHNVAFWSVHEQQYVCYFRVFSEGYRSVARCTSADFLHWSEAEEMHFGDTPREHIYTNETHPYFRAPHIYVAIAARFMPGRRVVSEAGMEALGGNTKYSGDCSDAIFMTTRGGDQYDRTFMEGFVRPGLGLENWTSRTNYPVYGLVPCGEGEMAFYINRNYGQDSAYIQRMKLRTDGFASVHAPYAGGRMTTRPLRFSGNDLVINMATSAAGDIRVEIQDADGTPLPGFSAEEADELIGDDLARVVIWRGESDLSALAGRTVRLCFIMKDADLYALQFRQKSG